MSLENKPIFVIYRTDLASSCILHYQLTVSTTGCSVKTTKGKWCHIPFTYRGKVYSSCTTDGHYRLWCSTTDNYDQRGFWGNCAASKLRLVLYLHKSSLTPSPQILRNHCLQFLLGHEYVPIEIRKQCVQGVQSYCFCSLNMQSVTSSLPSRCLREPGSNAVLHMSRTQFNQLGSCEVRRLTESSSTDFIWSG